MQRIINALLMFAWISVASGAIEEPPPAWNSTHVGIFNTILPNRWWFNSTHSRLVDGIRAQLNLNQGERLMSKLELKEGKGLVVVVYGASNMEDGGWYGGKKGKHKKNMDFWGRFMEEVQRRWPRTDKQIESGQGHVLLSLARTGTSLDKLFERSCSQAILPLNADLVFIDPHTVPSSIHALRYLVRRFLALPSPPAIVIISNVNSLSSNYEKRFKSYNRTASGGFPVYEMVHICTSRGTNVTEREAACNRVGDQVFPNATDDIQELREGFHRVAVDYGLAHIDLYALMVALIREYAGSLGVNQWALFCSIYRDILHFSGDTDQGECGGGSRLIADTLIAWLDQTLRRNQESMAMGEVNLESAICYDIDVGSEKRCERLGQNICPYRYYQEQVKELHSAIPDFKLDELPLQVTKIDGFELRHFYNSTNGLKYKPGYYAMRSGAFIDFDVSTDVHGSLSGLPSRADNSTFMIVVSFMASYDGWANATLSCHGNCTCDPVIAMGQLKHADKKASISENAHLTTRSLTRHCTVRVMIPPTAGDAYKFKITHVKVQAAKNTHTAR